MEKPEIEMMTPQKDNKITENLTSNINTPIPMYNNDTP